MVLVAEGSSADELYEDLWWKMKVGARKEPSRNGPVLVHPTPVIATLRDPTQRVLFNAARDCNPFFHVAEVVWMFSGSNDVSFIEQFNKRYRQYSDDGVVHGAYGHRWIKQFGLDQIGVAADLLRNDATSRRVVIQMWDAMLDLGTEANDLPCNTQIMFNVLDGRLDMLVTNRSNDLVWGMMGANVVHFTYLQEVVAHEAGLGLGSYRVVTNNLHIYRDLPRFEEIEMGALAMPSRNMAYPETYPILSGDETWTRLKEDCKNYVNGKMPGRWQSSWMNNVAVPMMEAYLAGPRSKEREGRIQEIQAEDWKKACEAWVARRK